ncbi:MULTISPECIES: pyruvate carboxylase [Staphylococcus]|uniref:Pyruvate carboxylase n=2 Tax=Staphylococcus TaxID=1279 RepID=A0A4Q9WSS3_STAHO|nr:MULTISPECIES: pyruvate carboxylase [Staphylococcus]EUZ69709.1 pyruvate carboxylase [Staphylococcus sp. M0480]OFK82559.1 pyruvate carboxylase [Staphylococcus sp. HMSC057A02]OFM63478.1 pyruvate carboxylase [Staphylococcus sp. HMSC062C01]OFM64215.1 pyruvate carboxylase [Staphylococcus sp. HMSC068D07]OFM93952.1 pyruvate carboxylase [Staphylococcus sp. HMSC078D05]OFN16543.1 pyruvate carboxylase [Staphylococcus sp. HMSC058D09]OFR07922.1 pyruvate carboxylase [Staphylococcus sp. HMSC078E07]OFS49
MNHIKKLLVANRGEIAIRIFRAATELNIQTVAIYSNEDKNSLHRYKADESYLVGKDLGPAESYLNIERIIEVAKRANVDAIHPGYGFLSENEEFARRCNEEGITFIGPHLDHLDMFGDKVKARTTAIKANLPVIPGTDGPIENFDAAKAFAKEAGFPLMIKATSGGGGKGMRIVREESELEDAFHRAKSEAQKSFGNSEVYIERYIDNPKHIEVQVIGDEYGNIVHLYERDCSVQRRHQKVVEVAPSVGLPDELRERICQSALQLMKNIKYVNAGTVEFLVSGDEFFFIEVNPRVQVEHTITEMITGIDIVKTQILVADGASLFDKRIALPPQEEIQTLGYAIQCRITTEDPTNDFMPDSGTIIAYRSSGGFGVRLDAGDGFQGAEISPYYDSLLVKLSTHAITFKQAEEKMERSLREMRIRGVKTNIPFLVNVMRNEKFRSGDYTTKFIEETPELFDIAPTLDRGTKTLEYIGNVTINGFPNVEKRTKPDYESTSIPQVSKKKIQHLYGTKQLLDEKGPSGVADWVKAQDDVLITDTTFRDAHQSLLATRVRTKDMLNIASKTAEVFKDSFSLEMWGGATFDVAYNFLKENPWERLEKLRKAIPNVLFQMLLRASNAVGYKNYPDNVIQKFVDESAKAGVDVFRIFDSLNWVDQMKVANEAVQKAGKISEGTICYTGDILNSERSNVFTLDYYVKLAKELEREGFHILAIKDMAGLLKPRAAYELVGELKAAVNLPIHLHTHDTSGNGLLTYKQAIDAGVDIIDTAIASMSGLTSQPSVNSLYYALDGFKRNMRTDIQGLEELSHYWSTVRPYYVDFESDIKSPNTEIYQHEMPGGQYSNLSQQAKSLGLGERFNEVKDMYRRVNFLFGDIVKVTPSSKVVGDMALYMVQNDLDEQSIIEQGYKLDFPESVVSYFKGEIGQPVNGFNKQLQDIILKGQQPLTERPGEYLKPVDFDEIREQLQDKNYGEVTEQDIISYVLYPKVFDQFIQTRQQYGNLSLLDTPTFFFGMRNGETVEIEIENGKRLIIKLETISEADEKGNRTIYYVMNGQARRITIKDENIKTNANVKPKADKTNPNHIGAQMPGSVTEVKVSVGDEVKVNQPLLITEAMKMETTIQAPFNGVIKKVTVGNGDAIATGDLLIEIEKSE